MGKMKELAIEMLDDEVDIVPPPYVYLMTCDGKPIAVYVDEATAEYEMHLCIQGDEAELGMHCDYNITRMTLITNHINHFDQCIGTP